MNTQSATRPATAYHGIHTSLYERLPTEAVQEIEKAIWLKITGELDAARAIFHNGLSAFENEPVVIIERADLEFQHNRWGGAWRILDSTLTRLRDTGADLNLPEYRLMSLQWSVLVLRHRGNVEPVPAELERTRRWLENVPVAKYTDIQTSCIRRYMIAYMYLRSSMSYQNDALESVPRDDEIADSMKPKLPWNGLHLLRRSLTSRKMFNEANTLFRVELNRTPLKDRDPILSEFLEEIVEVPPRLGRDMMESSVRLQWADTYVQLHNAAAATEELRKSEAAFARWCEEFGITEPVRIPQFHDLMAQKIELCADHSVRLQLSERLSSILECVGSGKLGSCISNATGSAYTLFESTGKEEYLTKYFALHKRLEQFDESESENLCDLIIHRTSLISVTQTNLVDRQKSLEWIDGFLQHYPYFASPNELKQLRQRRAMLLRGLQRLEEAKQEDEIVERLSRSGPVIGKWAHLSAVKAATSWTGPGPGPYDSEDEEDAFFYNMFTMSALNDSRKGAKAVANYLLDWLFEDASSGRIPTETYNMIMGIPGGWAEWKAKAKELKCDGHEHLVPLLLPDDDSTERQRNGRWGLLTNWLSNPPKGQRNKRLFCLLVLRKARCSHFGERKLWGLQISEVKHILQMEEKVPHHMRAALSVFKDAYGLLAEAYMAKFRERTDLLDADVYALVLEAERCCEQAIMACRNWLDTTAVQQRLGAIICLTKIRRFQLQLEHTHSDGVTRSKADQEAIKAEIMKIRATGLAKIKETEEIFTASELHASWSDGLNGINDRQGIARFHVSDLTIRIAIQLVLSEPGIPSQESITECWNAVQKSKARSLTRTIGIRTAIPEGLKCQILASDDARTLYEQMLRLQEQIENAETSARFDMRQQLDAHRRKSRQHPLLRRLIDLREGAPLELSDIATLEQEAGVPVVLVDWFYLPNYPDETTGTLIIFTARANRATTMDILKTKPEEVNAWQRKYLNPDQLGFMETRHQFDSLLGGLVEPLSHRTEPDEILVFCPSSTLHRLPLHALSIKTLEDDAYEVLIRRNPIVYIHSHSLLRLCFSEAENARHSFVPLNPQFLSGIPRSDEVNGHYKAGRDCITSLASRFGTQPKIDETASKDRFWNSATKSRLLHVHTHCNFDFEDPLDHHITFPKLESPTTHFPDSTDATDSTYPSKYKLTAKEVFNIRLLPGTHVNLIACSGGITDIKVGDEVMGLVPALLYSGAGSTVSTLWNIQDSDGARFSRVFFESFVEQCMEVEEATDFTEDMERLKIEGDGRKRAAFVDVALAMQDAVTQMDEYHDEPLLKWAGFVLHGFWQFAVSEEDMQSLRLNGHRPEVGFT